MDYKCLLCGEIVDGSIASKNKHLYHKHHPQYYVAARTKGGIDRLRLKSFQLAPTSSTSATEINKQRRNKRIEHNKSANAFEGIRFVQGNYRLDGMAKGDSAIGKIKIIFFSLEIDSSNNKYSEARLSVAVPPKFQFKNLKYGDVVYLRTDMLKKTAESFYSPTSLSYFEYLTPIKVTNNYGVETAQSQREDNKAYTSRMQIPWDYVDFRLGYVLVSNPYSPTAIGIKLKVEYSRTEYNMLKPLFKESGKVLFCLFTSDFLSFSIENIDIVKELVTNFEKRTEKPTISRTSKPKQGDLGLRKPISIQPSQIRQILGGKSSIYIDRLAALHNTNHTVFFCLETKQSSNSESRPEKAFIFTIAKHHEQAFVVYENTLESRSTIVFSINACRFMRAIHEIHKFFASDMENKREALQRGEVRFKSDIIKCYYRVVHNTFQQWKDDIDDVRKGYYR